jgi:hypothetical protein
MPRATSLKPQSTKPEVTLPRNTSPKSQSNTPEYYTNTSAAPGYNTKAPNYNNTEAPKDYTTTYAAPSYYTDARSISLLKSSCLKKKRNQLSEDLRHFNIFSALSVISCIPHFVTESQLWVDTLFLFIDFWVSISILLSSIC